MGSMMDNNVHRIACVIVNYNDFETTISLIEKIWKMSLLDVIIVVDNNSTDNSYTELKKYATDKVIVVRTVHNGGYGSGNNYGIEIARKEFNCEFAVIANPDVVFSEYTLSILKQYMIIHNKCAIAAPLQLNRYGFIENEYAWRIPSFSQSVFSVGHFLHHFFWPAYTIENIENAREKHNEEFYVECVPGSLLMISINKFLIAGGYDESIFLYYEETILALEMKNRGFYTALLLNCTYIHEHSVSINRSIRKRYKRKMIYMESLHYYLKEKLMANRLQMIIADSVMCISIFESIFKEFVLENKR